MPRPCKCRRVVAEPQVTAFKPAGVPGRNLDTIELGLDELEALRLADCEGLYHDAAAERMGVSRPTFGRMLESARHKVACALLQAKMLLFKGGPVMLGDVRMFECADCGARFGEPYGTGRPTACPQCQGANLRRAADDRGSRGAGDEGRVEANRGRGRCRRRRASWSRAARGPANVKAPADRPMETAQKEDQA